MPDNLHKNKFDSIHFKKTEWKSKNIGQIYSKALQDVLKRFKSVPLQPGKFFGFDDYPQYKNKMGDLFEKFSKNLTTEINKQSKESWDYAEKKNQDLLKGTMKKFGIKKIELRDKYTKSNLEALRAFQNRKEKGLNLSDRVWNQTKQFKQEIELAIDTGLRDGKSAADLSRDVKKYLNEPDKLFRKVRDNHGNLKLSKAAKAYHPGQGVYRSSSKNAMRLARTENNMAYHASNFEKYNDFDFVIGIRVILSNNPHHCPFCSSMAGDYPKEYKFVGWHPHCRCTTIPILKTKSEMEEDNDLIAQGLPPTPGKNKIVTTPKNYQEFIEVNQAKLDMMPNKPYWFKDNMNLKIAEPQILEKVKAVKTAYQKQIIQEKWDSRIEEHNAIKNNATNLINEYKDWNVKELDDHFSKFTIIQEQMEKLLKDNKLSDLKGLQQFYQFNLKELRIDVVNDWKKTLPNVNQYIGKYSNLEIEKALNASKAKLEYFEYIDLDPAYISKKLKFEIQWLEDKKPYNTWPISQNYFKDKLFTVQSQELFKQADESILFLQKELKKNPTKKGNDYLQNLIKSKENSVLFNDVDYIIDSIEDSNSYISIRKAKISGSKGLKGKEIKESFGDDGILPKDSYTKERRTNALYTSDPKVVDDIFRNMTEERWSKMTPEAQKTLWAYTNSSGKINRPLRGFEGSWYNEKGLGKVSFNQEIGDLPHHIKGLDLEKGIKEMAKEIENHKLPQDLWLRRGTDMSSFEGTFGISQIELAEKASKGTLNSLSGRKGVDNGFLSTSPAADSTKGFSGVIDYKIFAPKGTQAIYAEPFSSYGRHDHTVAPWKTYKNQKQTAFSSEFETIINQGYEYEILDIEKNQSGGYTVRLQVLSRSKRHKYY